MKKIFFWTAGILLALAALLTISIVYKAEKTLKTAYQQVREKSRPLNPQVKRLSESGIGQVLVSATHIHDIEYVAGQYWIATSGGICLLNSSLVETDRFTTLNGLWESDVRKFIPFENQVYALFQNGQLASLAGGLITRYHSTPLVDGAVVNGELFLASESTIFKKDKEQLVEIGSLAGIKKIFGSERLYAITRSNRLYQIGSHIQKMETGDFKLIEEAKELNQAVQLATEKGLYTSGSNRYLFPNEYIKDFCWFEGETVVLTASGNILTSRSRTKLLSEESNGFRLKQVNQRLFAMGFRALHVLENGRWQRIAIASDLSWPFITTICRSPDTLWAGTLDRGVLIIRNRLESAHRFLELEVNDSLVRSGTPYFATTFGVAAIEKGKLQWVKDSDNHYSNALLNQGDTLYAGTSHGLLKIGPAGLELYNVLQHLCNYKIFSLAADGPNIWCGTMGGLSLFDGQRFTRCLSSLNSSLKDNWISNLCQVNGRIYFTTYNGEVGRISGQAVEIIDSQNIVFNFNNIQGRGPYLFAGTYGSGIYVLNTESGQSALITARLPSQNVTDLIIQDDELIAATDSGLYFIEIGQILSELNI